MAEFQILSLDGGGAKGVYTLGVLLEVEAVVQRPLSEVFDLVYGTSTGSIIAALIALGRPITEVRDLYFDLIPQIMCHNSGAKRSQALRTAAESIFGNYAFADFKTDIGIVTTQIDYARPMIFKSSIRQAHGRKSTFEPGFGASIVDAIMASCAAFPFFNKIKIKTSNQGSPLLMDGGFVANNPTIFALIDAINAFDVPINDIGVLSVGVGSYREPARRPFHEFVLNLWPFWMIRKTLDCNTNTNELIVKLLLRDIHCVRINDTFAERDYETDLLESNPDKLDKLFQLGRESFAKQEDVLRSLLGVYDDQLQPA